MIDLRFKSLNSTILIFRNRELYAKYQRLSAEEPGVTFVGRLASYKYFNMDQAILNALELFDKLVDEGKIEKKK